MSGVHRSAKCDVGTSMFKNYSRNFGSSINRKIRLSKYCTLIAEITVLAGTSTSV